MISQLRATSVLKDITYLDPELNGDVEYLRIAAHSDSIWHQVRRYVCSPSIVTLAVLITLLMLGAYLPS
jgi:hypothetical protein